MLLVDYLFIMCTVFFVLYKEERCKQTKNQRNMSWQGCWRTLVHFWWKCKVSQLLRKAGWKLLRTVRIEWLCTWPFLPLVIYTEEFRAETGAGIYIPKSLGLLFNILKYIEVIFIITWTGEQNVLGTHVKMSELPQQSIFSCIIDRQWKFVAYNSDGRNPCSGNLQSWCIGRAVLQSCWLPAASSHGKKKKSS